MEPSLSGHKGICLSKGTGNNISLIVSVSVLLQAAI